MWKLVESMLAGFSVTVVTREPSLISELINVDEGCL
jgi:hypothetical protein